MSQLLLKGGRVIDPSQGIDKIADVLIRDGKIEGIGEFDQQGLDHVEDVTGKYVLPGLIDMHVHLREPGFEYKEDIASGSKAAAAGGFTAVAAMPNTSPFMDNRAIIEYVIRRGEAANFTRVLPIGALTKEMKGEEMAEIGEMIEGGAVAFSDDAFPIASSGMMRRVMEYCAMFGVPVILHCEDKSLCDDGLMNEGITATTFGLRGICNEVEDIAVARNLMLARLTGCKVHIAHVSTRGSVELIRRAKAEGTAVTCETCPQYFTLTEEAVIGYRTNAKMSPPLRTAEDVEAVKAGLADGTIDVIATDHAPHSLDEKETEFAVAANGIVGLETSVGLVMTELVKAGVLSMADVARKMSQNPAGILGLESGALSEGADADISVIDPSAEWTVDPAKFCSKGRNTPFVGRKLVGKPVLTVLRGRVVARDGMVV